METMSLLQDIPATIRVFLVFAFVLFTIRKKCSLGTAFLLGAVVLGLMFGLGPQAIVAAAWTSVIYPKTLLLAVIVSLILILSSSMATAGQMKRLLANFEGLVAAPKINLVVFPALIGLLPMPGGAVFSAPMVKELGNNTSLGPDSLSYINYWFRHIWEYWWPLYPGVLLTTALADVNLWTFVTFMCPLTVAAFLFGYIPLRGIASSELSPRAVTRPSVKPFFLELIPIIIVIVLGLGIGLGFSLAAPACAVSKEAGLIIALCIAIGWIWRQNRFDGTRIRKLLTDPHIMGMIYMVIAIFVFKGMMEGSHAVEIINNEFTMLHIPLAVVAMLLPFLVGGVVGITIAFVGSTFPILIALISAYGETQYMMAYMMLALACGFAGVILSPLHLCLLLSNQYFGTTLGAVYKRLWLPSLCFVVLSVGYFFILRRLLS